MVALTKNNRGVKEMISVIYYITMIVKKIVGSEIAKMVLSRLSGGEKFFYTERIFSSKQRGTINRLVILLPGKGCWWAKQKGGGCTMCGFGKRLEEAKAYRYSARDLTILCKIALKLCEKETSEVVIFNGGSFLNQEEIPFEAQEDITRLIARSSIQRFYVESRPEFITSAKIQKLTNLLSNKKLMIGIGLEAATDSIREKNINKGFGLSEYERVVKVLAEAKVELLTYVFLKPIGLNEKEAIQEAIKTIAYAFSKGSEEIALESALIQEGTVMAKLFNQGKYRPPWLWSVIEVARKTYNLGFVHIGAFNDEPPPLAIPSNCPLCTEKVSKSIQYYRENHSLKEFKSLICQCQKEWKREISNNKA